MNGYLFICSFMIPSHSIASPAMGNCQLPTPSTLLACNGYWTLRTSSICYHSCFTVLTSYRYLSPASSQSSPKFFLLWVDARKAAPTGHAMLNCSKFQTCSNLERFDSFQYAKHTGY
ncbi:hypothetical protein C8R42DRAFT_656465 [Lentinula raphanica]|nr:hypothetical protein C8R42DRAFT_656465 [Lentinula raphanica]